MTRKLVALIEDMMINESKRFVALRLKRESVSIGERGRTHEEMQRARMTLERLAHFHAALLEKWYAALLEKWYEGIELPEVVSARTHAVVR